MGGRIDQNYGPQWVTSVPQSKKAATGSDLSGRVSDIGKRNLDVQQEPESKRSGSELHAKDITQSEDVSGTKEAHVESVAEKVLPARLGHLRATRQQVQVKEKRAQKEERTLDLSFTCHEKVSSKFSSEIEELLTKSEGFDTRSFLAARGRVEGEDKEILVELEEDFRKLADAMLQFCKEQAIELRGADGTTIPLNKNTMYRQLIGMLDTLEGKKQAGTFPLRCALLNASVADGTPIDSWQVFTLGDKPIGRQVWSFLDDTRNWVPEVQGMITKFWEASVIDSLKLSAVASKVAQEELERGDFAGALAAARPACSEIVLMKGGFGAGKTSRIRSEYGTEHGSLAPDLAKKVVRDVLPAVSHGLAHIQGSQIAESLFTGLIQEVSTTCLYDSALPSPKDVDKWLDRGAATGKKVVIHDVTRYSGARMIAVLARSVSGSDPRIAPRVVRKGICDDEINRAACMSAALKRTKPPLPEYHLYSDDGAGADSQEVFSLKDGKAVCVDPDRMARMGLQYDATSQQVHAILHPDDLGVLVDRRVSDMFTMTVRDMMQRLTPTKDSQRQQAIFEERSFTLAQTGIIDSPETFYQALPDEVKAAITELEVKDAFNEIGEDKRISFFNSIRGKASFSYMDFPLGVALAFHSSLKKSI